MMFFYLFKIDVFLVYPYFHLTSEYSKQVVAIGSPRSIHGGGTKLVNQKYEYPPGSGGNKY